MFNYEKLFEPFSKDGATVENSIKWLEKSTLADRNIIDQAIADTMDKVSQGEKFELPCPCGCGMTNIHTPINHYMLSRVVELKDKIEKSRAKILEEAQKSLLQSQQKQLSKFDKEYFVMMHGKWYNRLWQWLTTYEGIR